MSLKNEFGWSPSDSEQDSQDHRYAATLLNQLIIKAFTNNCDLLIYLRDNYLMQAVAPPNALPSMPYFREGQNDLIRLFINTIEGALNGRIDDINTGKCAGNQTGTSGGKVQNS